MNNVITARLAPYINQEFYISGTQYYYPSGGEHGGLDLSTNKKDPLYSMVNGKVLSVRFNDPSYGNYIIIQDDNGVSWLYAHMDSISVSVNQRIKLGELVGVEGETGNVTGIHVHLELQLNNPGESWKWNIPYSQRPNIAEYLGLTNTRGLRAIYYGVSSKQKKNNFNWILYAKKLREKRSI